MIELYVGRNKKKSHKHDLGSVLCLHMNQFLEEKLQVIDATLQKPAWLTGTPTIRDDTLRLWTGFEAYDFVLQKLIQELKTKQNKKEVSSSSAFRTNQKQPSLQTDDTVSMKTDSAAAQDMFSSMVSGEEEEEEPLEERKLTNDDYSRIINERRS